MKMSTLLPDESYCKTDLGLMLYKERKVYAFFCEIINVIEPISFFGHVDYDIVLRAIPQNSLNYSSREFCFTSRFKELNRLYLQLSTIHRQLYLKNTFPSFVEAKLFGSSTPETILERRRAIETFLNFVIKNEVLCKSKVFQNFIENAKENKKSCLENGDISEPSENLSTDVLSANSFNDSENNITEEIKT